MKLIDPEVNSSSSCELVAQRNSVLPGYNGEAGMDRHSHFKREKSERRKCGVDPKEVQNLARQIPLVVMF